MSRWQAELDLATRAAKKAGARLRELAMGERKILSAVGHDIKTQADQDSERIILDELRAGSAWPVLAEESGEHGAAGQGAYWVVDPLDGTLNFSRGLPLYCISIALLEGDQPRVGVIYDLNRDEVFQGIAGEGAWINGEPVRVSDVADPAGAVLATGFPSYMDYSGPALAQFVGRVQRFKKIRMLGTAALMLAYVGCGRVDAYTEEDIMLWDVAAGVAIALGAGGWADLQPSARHKWGRLVRVGSSAKLFEE